MAVPHQQILICPKHSLLSPYKQPRLFQSSSSVRTYVAKTSSYFKVPTKGFGVCLIGIKTGPFPVGFSEALLSFVETSFVAGFFPCRLALSDSAEVTSFVTGTTCKMPSQE